MTEEKRGFSEEWDVCYKNNQQQSIWPWSDLVSYIMRYARPSGNDTTVLELGCGVGANIPFFRHLGVKYYAIEGSKTAVCGLWEKYPEYRKTIVAGDFTSQIPFDTDFDLVVDRSSLTHNDEASIKECLRNVYDRLTVCGKFIGIDWFSTAHSDYEKGREAGESYTRISDREGQFAGVGRVHFSDKDHILELFSHFTLKTLEHKIIKREIPGGNHTFASWNLAAVKE